MCHYRDPRPLRTWYLVRPIIMLSDRWIEKRPISERNRVGRFPINDQIVRSYAVKKNILSIPTISIEQIHRSISSIKPTVSTGYADRIARLRNDLKSTASVTTPDNTRSHPTTAPTMASPLLSMLLLTASKRSTSVLRAPAARAVIRWQQRVLSMTLLQHR